MEGSLKIEITTQYPDLVLGESVAVNGVCLTLTELTPQATAFFFVSSETLDRSNFNELRLGSLLNLERAVTLQTRLSGHLVQGHVDGIAIFLEAIPQSGSQKLRFEIPSLLARYCVEKGSIALNGVSLTINSIQCLDPKMNPLIEVTMIPHTRECTNLSVLKPQEKVNIEIDVLAKYVEKLCHP